jgi:hypothetical protein
MGEELPVVSLEEKRKFYLRKKESVLYTVYIKLDMDYLHGDYEEK